MSKAKKEIPPWWPPGRPDPVRDGWVTRPWGDVVPEYKNLRAAMAALESGEPLDQELRAYISLTLDFLCIALYMEEQRHTRGRRREH